MNSQLKSTIDNFDLGVVQEISKIPSGLINLSYRITSSTGSYIMQRMGDIFTKETIEDMEKVTQHLKIKSINTPTLLRTTSEQLFHTDVDGHLWRVMTAMDGETYESLDDDGLAQEAGRVLAEFHKGMQDFDASQLQNHLKLHQTRDIYAEYCNYVEELLTTESDPLIKEAITYIQETLPDTYLPVGLPTTVIHGDPKISNIIFKDGVAVCMIDLDTCIEHSSLVDLGDALWSWVGSEGDDPNNRFSLARFEAAMRGYMSVIPLSTDEQHYVYRGARMIALELASRFAKDTIDDSYFGWDADRYKSRKAHNRARMLSMVRLEQDIVRKKDRIIDILNNI